MTDTDTPRDRSIDPRLLEILACPVTKTSLDYDKVNQELISRAAKLAFPIRDGIPILLVEEARPLGDTETPVLGDPPDRTP